MKVSKILQTYQTNGYYQYPKILSVIDFIKNKM